MSDGGWPVRFVGTQDTVLVCAREWGSYSELMCVCACPCIHVFTCMSCACSNDKSMPHDVRNSNNCIYWPYMYTLSPHLRYWAFYSSELVSVA